MKIEMLSTGDEVLQGDIADTNAAWLGQRLNELGLCFSRRQTVADNLDDIVDALKQAAARSDYVIVNGGLGPTGDDITTAAVAKLIAKPLELNALWLSRLEAWYAKRKQVMPPANLKQAMLPEGAELLDNPIGTACGFALQIGHCWLYFTPGVPSELKLMVEQQILPRINSSKTQHSTKRFFSFGCSESVLEAQLTTLDLSPEFHLGFRSARPSIEVKLSGDSQHPLWQQNIDAIRESLGEFCFSEDQRNWAEKIQNLMLAQQQQLVLAESCTGGMLAAELVAVAGSSAYFERGIVSYSNQAKQELLAVSSELIDTSGAVSEDCAIAMAKGALAQGQATIALSITGIAGPGGGTPEKPVGTVCFSLVHSGTAYTQTLLFNNQNRSVIRLMAMSVAMDMLRRQLQGLSVFPDYDHTQRISSQTGPI